MELYDWQRRAVDYFFKNDCTAILEIATGAGKTFCAIEIIKKIWEEDPNAYILIVVPKNVILETGWYKELTENGVSLKDVGVYYGRIKEYSKITITNMQNLNKIPFDSYSNMFNCIILDEVHNYGTDAIMEYLKYPFKYKLGLTATMERMDCAHWKLQELFKWNIFQYTPKEALRDNILNQFDFVNIGIEMDDDDLEFYNNLTSEINSLIKIGGSFSSMMRSDNPSKSQLLAKMNTRKKLVNNYYKKFDIVQELCLRHKNDKIIVFNQFNEQTNKCYWKLSGVGINACIIHSGVPQQERSKNIIDFKNNKIKVVLTSKVLDEGYNMPDIDCAIIMANDSSSRQLVQRMGRVLRKKEKISNLYQIYCTETIEEDYMKKNMMFFKELSNSYDEFVYDGREEGGEECLTE